MGNINERIRTLIQEATTEHRRFKELEELTKIPTATWKTFWSRGSNPSAQMIEALAKQWPEYSFWLATGITDSERGHRYPGDLSEPAGSLEQLTYVERRAAARLFRAEIDRQQYVEEKLAENPHFEEDAKLQKLESLIKQLRQLRDEEERTLNELERNLGNEHNVNHKS